MKIRLALIQMDIILRRIEENLRRVDRFLDEALRFNPEIISLPELFSTGYDLEYIKEKAEEIKEVTLNFIQNKARELNCYILAGSMPEKENEKIYNTSFFINKKGEILFKYRKINLFPPFKEDRYFCKGKEISWGKIIKEGEGILIGSLICYDLRFPHLFKELSQKKVDIIFLPSQFPNPRLNHWEILLKARAIENQIYIVGINRVGEDKDRSYFGNSMVVDPWGEVLANAFYEEKILFSEVDLEKIKEVKERFSLKD
jgi:predicted amidohydrolase